MSDKRMKILVVEDEPSLIFTLRDTLESEGYDVVVSEEGTQAIEMVKEHKPDLMLLDIMLPGKSGYDIMEELRKEKYTFPVIMLTAKDQEPDKVKGLSLGADDYLTKPFNTEELIARMTAIKRRTESGGEQQISCGELKVNLLKREFTINKEPVQLTNNEFNLLVYFMKNRNRVITQEELAEKVWDIHFDTQTNYINVYISYLRKKIREHTEVDYIETIRKKGFAFRCD